MTQSYDHLLQESRRAMRAGQKESARQLLRQAVQQQPNDYRAWLGLAAAAGSPQESLGYIEKAEAIQPDNPAVQKGRAWAEQQMARQGQSSSLPFRKKPIREKSEAVPIQNLSPEPSPFVPAILLRQIIGGAAILAVLIAMGIVTWFAWNAWLRGEGLVAEPLPTPIQTPQTAGLGGSQPAVELSANIAPEGQAIAAAASATPTPNPIQPKEIIQSAGDPRPRWTATLLPTQTPTPTPTWAPTFVSPISDATLLKPIGLFPNERWIDISLSTQSLVAYEGDIPVFETLVSSGKVQYPTVMGQFRIWLRFEKQDMDGRRLGYDYYLKDVPYVQYFYQDYALHGTFWHTNFGRQMSHGCVNLSPADAQWLYNFADYGTLVNVHE